jgi:transcriptional regulator
MYLTEHFAEHRAEELQRIMREFPLGTIVTHTDQGLDANHIPFELDAQRGACGTLQGHIARANPLWKDVPDGAQVLVIFRGHDGYISPSWYPSKHETHRHVPTWNYEVVHVHGRLRIVDDEKFVRGMRLSPARHGREPVSGRYRPAPADGWLRAAHPRA